MKCTNCPQDATVRCAECYRPFCSGSECSQTPLFVGNIDTLTNENEELHAFPFQERCNGRIQLGLSSIPSGAEISWEVHKFVTQFIRIESGQGYLEVVRPFAKSSERFELSDGVAAVIPQGMAHRIVSTGQEPLKLYAIYAKDSDTKEWLH